MRRRNFIKTLSFATVGAMPLASSCTPSPQKQLLKEGEIIHSVMFNLKHESNSEAAIKFIEDGRRILSAIPSVRNFEAYKQVSQKCNFDYGFSMVFTDQSGYNQYNEHPDHVAFVQSRWELEVESFQEIDYKKF